ncbi:uncharacterized protein A4U43_C05F22830 [Asparagus officinalis]|uniref:Protein kinase domain-containing protein n=1 Tax=Asparagus officinalis TaxID=4686 RepID=A0A5P1ETX4_ASPOF|nr:uncharacterized protein A4U43_C05F22830 [Asparagus officinalis]
MKEIGWLMHPNLVPLRAYFQAKEEKLLVYDYFPNGSLFSLIHELVVVARKSPFLKDSKILSDWHNLQGILHAVAGVE